MTYNGERETPNCNLPTTDEVRMRSQGHRDSNYNIEHIFNG